MTGDEPAFIEHIGANVYNLGQTGFTTGDRVWHRRRGWAAFQYFDGHEESVVEFGDGEWARVTTALLMRSDDPNLPANAVSDRPAPVAGN